MTGKFLNTNQSFIVKRKCKKNRYYFKLQFHCCIPSFSRIMIIILLLPLLFVGSLSLFVDAWFSSSFRNHLLHVFPYHNNIAPCRAQYTTITRSTSDDSSDFTCTNSLGCIINCTAYKSCTGSIYCSSNGDYCEINCNDDQSCMEATIYGESTKTVIITFDRDYAGYDSTIYAPDNDGSLTVIVKESLKGFRYGTIIDADNSGSITLVCTNKDKEYSGSYDACDDVFIDATSATFLNVTAVHDGEFTDSTVYCPIDSSYPGTSCLIDCTYVLHHLI